MTRLRMTHQTQAVLPVLLADPTQELYGLKIAELTGLLPGTTYPILSQLERVGWGCDRWEDVDPREEQRTRRHYFRVTAEGAVAARHALDHVQRSLVQVVQQLGLDDGVADRSSGAGGD